MTKERRAVPLYFVPWLQFAFSACSGLSQGSPAQSAGTAQQADAPSEHAETATATDEERLEEQRRAQAEERDKALLQAQHAEAAGQFERAAQYYQQAIRLGAEERPLAAPILRAYVSAKHYRMALSFARDYLERTPNDIELRYLQATILLALRENEEAIVALETVVHQAPRHAEGHYALGVLLRDHRGDLAAADHHFRTYLELEPEGPHSSAAQASLLKTVP